MGDEYDQLSESGDIHVMSGRSWFRCLCSLEPCQRVVQFTISSGHEIILDQLVGVQSRL